jgi:hypothetical protein
MEKIQWNKNKEHQDSIEEIVRITSNHIETYPKDNVYFCLIYDYLDDNNEEKIGVLSTKNTNENMSVAPISFLVAQIIKAYGEEYLMATIEIAKQNLMEEQLQDID